MNLCPPNKKIIIIISTKIKAIKLLLPVINILLITCNNRLSDDLANNVSGDYLIDDKEMSAVFITSVYNENDTLYALSGIADYTVEMKLVKTDPVEFIVQFKQSGEFYLQFSNKEDGVFQKLIFGSESQGFEMNGNRVELEYMKLRERYSQEISEYEYKKPLKLNDGLQVASVYETGFDSTALFNFMNSLINNYDYMHSFLIIKDGKLILEEYLNGWDPARIHRMQSVTKSFTSTIVWLAIREGYINSINDYLYNYLPEYDSLFNDEKKKITIQNVLTMSAGFKWNERITYYADPEAGDVKLGMASGDFIGYLLAKPLLNEPGAKHEYTSPLPDIMGYIIEKESGMNLLKFSHKYLFDDLGINQAYWARQSPEDKPSCAGGLRLTSRDMAKYGLMYLQNGRWKNKQLVPEEWIKESTKGHIERVEEGGTYGYFFKRIISPDGNLEMFFASGTGGQYIVCIPELDIVIVTTAKYNTDKGDELAALMLEKLFPALN